MAQFTVSSATARQQPLSKVMTRRFDRLADLGWHRLAGDAHWQAAARSPDAIVQEAGFTIVGMARLTITDAPEALTGQDALRLILQMHRTGGAAQIATLNGAFSCVIVDPDTGRLDAYRDPFGIYPLYHIMGDGCLTLGIDPRETLHASAQPLAPNLLRIADFVVGEEIDPTLTAFTGLLRVPAAHHLSWDGADLVTEQYWTLNTVPTPPASGVPAQLCDLLRRATNVAVSGDKPVGSMMSGGLDSSAISGLAAQALTKTGRGPLKTLSFVFGRDKSYDESEFIDAGNAMFHATPVPILREKAPSLDEIDTLIEEQFDFFQAPGLPKSRALYSIAKDQGLDAILDGHGGDECISHGFARLIELAAHRKWIALWVNMRGVARIYGTTFTGQYLTYIVRYGGFKPRSLRRRAIAKLARFFMEPQAKTQSDVAGSDLLLAAITDLIDPKSRYAPKPDPSTVDAFRQAETLAHRATLEGPLISHAFEVLHRAGAAAGVEPRYPFFDQTLVQFCVSAPSEAKLRKGQTRWMLREAMRGIMPDMICDRMDKADFSDEMATSVRAFYACKTDTVFDDLASFVNIEAAQTLRRSLDSSDISAASLKALWRLAVLSQWTHAMRRWQQSQAEGTLVS